MTKSQLHVKQICLPSLILNVRNNEKNHHDADIMICDFHISHNAPFCPPPLQKKFFITFVFHFFWVLQPSQEKLKTMLMQNLGGGQIRSIMGEVQAAYGILWQGIV